MAFYEILKVESKDNKARPHQTSLGERMPSDGNPAIFRARGLSPVHGPGWSGGLTLSLPLFPLVLLFLSSFHHIFSSLSQQLSLSSLLRLVPRICE